MVSQRQEELLIQMKQVKPIMEAVHHYPLKILTKALTAWPSIFLRLAEDDGRDAGATQAEQFLWLWGHCLLDFSKAFLLMGGSCGDLIERLAAGYIIYPDGNYSQEFIHTLLLQQAREKRNG